MPDNTDYTPIQAAWIDFTGSVRPLLVPQLDDRPLDQFLEFRDTVFTIVEGQQFLNELQMGWNKFTTTPNIPPNTASVPRNAELSAALLMELKAFRRAVEVAQATEKESEESKGWVRRWAGKLLGRASTAAGSVNDLLEDLPFFAKGGITLFKELIEMFRPKD